MPVSLPVASVLPLGLICAVMILLASPPSQRVTGFQSAVDHTCVRPKRLPTTSSRPSGLKRAKPTKAATRTLRTRRRLRASPTSTVALSNFRWTRDIVTRRPVGAQLGIEELAAETQRGAE